jgi:phage pi2 protein 07
LGFFLPCLRKLIDKVNSVITLLDNLEELITLSLEEWNRRDILKNHVITLLQNKKNLLEAKRENKMGETRKCKYKIFS